MRTVNKQVYISSYLPENNVLLLQAKHHLGFIEDLNYHPEVSLENILPLLLLNNHFLLGYASSYTTELLCKWGLGQKVIKSWKLTGSFYAFWSKSFKRWAINVKTGRFQKSSAWKHKMKWIKANKRCMQTLVRWQFQLWVFYFPGASLR